MNTLRYTSHGMFGTFYVNPKAYHGQHLDYDKSYSTQSSKNIEDLKEFVANNDFTDSEKEIKLLSTIK